MEPSFDQLPTRINNLLSKAGIKTVADLVWINDYDLQQIEGIGLKSVETIRKTFGKSIVYRNVYDQCNLLNMPYVEIRLPKKRGGWESPVSNEVVRIEKAALDYYFYNNWVGLDWEGAPVDILMDASSMSYRWKESGMSLRSFLKSVSTYGKSEINIEISTNFERKKYIGYWEWKNDLGYSLEELIGPSMSITETELKANIHDYLHIHKCSDDQHMFVVDFLIRLWKMLGKETFRKLLYLNFDLEKNIMFDGDRFNFSNGWPDLTLIKENKFKFVEVKSNTDKFHWSQIRAYKNIAEPLSLPWHTVIVKPC